MCIIQWTKGGVWTESNFRQKLLSGKPTSVTNCFYQVNSLKYSLPVFGEMKWMLLSKHSGIKLRPSEGWRRKS